MNLARSLTFALVCLALFAPQQATAQKFTSPYSEVSLISETARLVPGETAWVGLHIKMRPGWHTYWRNPGDSGLPTRIAWSLPNGIAAGDIHWPIPEKFAFGPFAGFGYKNETLLMVPLAVDGGAGAGGEATVTADATWLVCEDICVPERAQFSLTLPVADRAAGPRNPLFRTYRDRLPAEPPIAAEGRQTAQAIRISARLPAAGWRAGDGLEFFPASEGAADISAPQSIRLEGRRLVVELKPEYLAEESRLTVLEGVLVSGGGTGSGRKGIKLIARFNPGT